MTARAASSVRAARSPHQPREIAPFLKSLRTMLDDESDAVLRWTPDGRAFEIRDVQALTKIVLPKYFKHAKYASFQRQLNYFNFRKWTKSRTEVCTFANPHFQRDEPHLSWRILRKRSLADLAFDAKAPTSPSTAAASNSSSHSHNHSHGSSSGSCCSDDNASLCESPHSELDVTLGWIDAVFPSLEMLSALGQDEGRATSVARRRDAPMPQQSVEYVSW